MRIITYKQHLFLNVKFKHLSTVLQVPGNLRRKILVAAVGTKRTLLFQPRHGQESVPLKDVVLECQTRGNPSGRGRGCKVNVGELPTSMTSEWLWSDWHYDDGRCHAAATSL
jgi:hypothetical protein